MQYITVHVDQYNYIPKYIHEYTEKYGNNFKLFLSFSNKCLKFNPLNFIRLIQKAFCTYLYVLFPS